MRRRLVKLGVFLVLGAAINVAVAWGCRSVSLATFATEQGSILDGRPAPIYVIGRSKPGHARLELFPVRRPTEFFEGMPDYLDGDHIHPRMLGAGPSVPFAWPSNFHAAASVLGDRESLRVELIGWPCAALQASRPTSFADELARVDQKSYSGDHVSNMVLLIWQRSWPVPTQGEPDLSPWRPCWPGFAINTLIFAAGLAMVAILIRLIGSAAACLTPRGRIKILVLTVVLGLVSTVAVAWTSAIREAQVPNRFTAAESYWGGKRAEDPNPIRGYHDWEIVRNDTFTSVHCISQWMDGDFQIGIFSGAVPSDPAEPLVPYWGSMIRPTAGTGGRGHEVSVHAHGWPMCALWWGHPDGAKDDTSLATIRGIWLSSGKRPLPWGGTQNVEYVLPIQPIWFGLAVDVVAGAAIWLVLASAFIHLTVGKRRRRMRRGLCPSCKYPVGASPVCTECGSPVKPKPVEAAS